MLSSGVMLSCCVVLFCCVLVLCCSSVVLCELIVSVLCCAVLCERCFRIVLSVVVVLCIVVLLCCARSLFHYRVMLCCVSYFSTVLCWGWASCGFTVVSGQSSYPVTEDVLFMAVKLSRRSVRTYYLWQ